MANSALIDGSPQGSKVVVKTDALKLTVLTIKVEALVGHELYRTHAKGRGVCVLQTTCGIYAGDGFI